MNDERQATDRRAGDPPPLRPSKDELLAMRLDNARITARLLSLRLELGLAAYGGRADES